MAPIERVKLLLQVQDANAQMGKSGTVKYTGMTNCFTRVYAEQVKTTFLTRKQKFKKPKFSLKKIIMLKNISVKNIRVKILVLKILVLK